MYLINEVAQKVNLSQKRIREYEKEGFINPLREERTQNRLFSDFEVAQIKRIAYLIHNKGFTLACLRSLLVLAPCWNIFGCKRRWDCAAHRNPHRVCWEIRNNIEVLCDGPCARCAIYLNRNYQKEQVLEPVEPSMWELAADEE
jgi:hypothetical protein